MDYFRGVESVVTKDSLNNWMVGNEGRGGRDGFLPPQE